MTDEDVQAVRRGYDEWSRGKVIRLEIFATRERALAEVGLAPGREPRG